MISRCASQIRVSTGNFTAQAKILYSISNQKSASTCSPSFNRIKACFFNSGTSTNVPVTPISAAHRCAVKCTGLHRQLPTLSFSLQFSSRRRIKNGEKRTNSDNSRTDDVSKATEDSGDIDDLKALWKDNSLSLTAKTKVLFQQYGVVLVVVHLMTAVFWMTIFYLAVSWGFDVVSFLETHGVFDFLNRIGLPVSDKLKSPGASNLLSAYLIYELAKPIRLPVTFFATIYAVRLLRRLKYLKPPPKAEATVYELVTARRKIARHDLNKTTSKYRDRYRASKLKLRNRLKRKNANNGKNR